MYLGTPPDPRQTGSAPLDSPFSAAWTRPPHYYGGGNCTWGTPPDPRQTGSAPLDSPFSAAWTRPPHYYGGGNCTWGTPPDPRQRGSAPLDSPFSAAGHVLLTTMGVEIVPGGLPQTPAKGAPPLWTPLFPQLDTSSSLLWGWKLYLGDSPRPPPKGLRPSGLPFFRSPLAAKLETVVGGEHSRARQETVPVSFFHDHPVL